MKSSNTEKKPTRKGRIASEIIALLQTSDQLLTGAAVNYLFARISQMVKLYEQTCLDLLNAYDPDVPLYHQACNIFNHRNFLNLAERACDHIDALENTEYNLETIHNHIACIKDAPLKKGFTRFNKVAILTVYAALINRYNEICEQLNYSTLDSNELYSTLENNIFPQDDKNNARFFNRRKNSPELIRIYMKPLENYKFSWTAFDQDTQDKIREHVFDQFNHCDHLRAPIRKDPTLSAWIATYVTQKKDQELITIYAYESDYPESYINHYLRTKHLNKLIATTNTILQKYKINALQQSYLFDATPDLLAKRAILTDETLMLRLLSNGNSMFLKELCQDPLFLQEVHDSSSIANTCFTEIAPIHFPDIPCVNKLLEEIKVNENRHQIEDSPRPLTPGSAPEN